MSPIQLRTYLYRGSGVPGLPNQHPNDMECITLEGYDAIINCSNCYTKAWGSRSLDGPYTQLTYALGMFNIKYFDLCDGLISDSQLKERLNKAIKICELIRI